MGDITNNLNKKQNNHQDTSNSLFQDLDNSTNNSVSQLKLRDTSKQQYSPEVFSPQNQTEKSPKNLIVNIQQEELKEKTRKRISLSSETSFNEHTQQINDKQKFQSNLTKKKLDLDFEQYYNENKEYQKAQIEYEKLQKIQAYEQIHQQMQNNSFEMYDLELLQSQFSSNTHLMHSDFSLYKSESNNKNDSLKITQSVQDPQLLKYLVKNIDTGEIQDIRSLTFSQGKKQVTTLKKTGWKNYWVIFQRKKVREKNELFWDAVENGDLNKIEELLDSKNDKYCAEVNSKLLDDFTSLHLAVNEGHLKICEFLLDKGANIEAKTKSGRTPLHLASIRGNYMICKFLIDKNAFTNAQDEEKCTPLHYIAYYSHIELVKLFIESGANTELKNYLNMTPKEYSLDVEIREIFSQIDKTTKTIDDHDDFYGRTTLRNVVIPNSRADFIQKLLNLNRTPQKSIVEKKKPDNITQNNSRKQIYTNALVKYQELNRILKIPVQKAGPKEKVGPQSFNILHMLGKGSFGEVYLVQKKDTQKLYAMKVLQKEQVLKQNLTRYAKSERNVLSYMDHPFIVKLHYAFQTDTKLYLILKYCSGGDLSKIIQKRKKFPEDLARIYCAEILLSLEVLHKNGIVFRDLKPGNIVIDEEGHAQLTDFGLAKEGVFNKTSNSFCGSIAYLAPEILKRIGHTRTVDWYLLGVLLYEMLVGIPPYYNSNRDQLFNNILNAQLKLPSSLSENAKDLIKKLLQRNQNQRLGAERDAEEIKEHPFFKSINWENLYQRKYQMPKYEVKVKNSKSNKNFDDCLPENREVKHKIENWSFCKQ